MKTVTMDFDIYQDEISRAEANGFRFALLEMVRIARLIKGGDKSEAALRLIEVAEGLPGDGMREIANSLNISLQELV